MGVVVGVGVKVFVGIRVAVCVDVAVGTGAKAEQAAAKNDKNDKRVNDAKSLVCLSVTLLLESINLYQTNFVLYSGLP